MPLAFPGELSRSLGRVVYGMRVFGLDSLVELTSDPSWDSSEALTLRVGLGEREREVPHPLDARRAVEPVGTSHQWVLDRAAHTAELIGPPLDLDLVAHPCLAPVASVFNRWAGRESFHAASFEVAERGYGVIGGRTAGKSTLMAGLALRGVTVLSDDLVITDGVDVFAGPRCLDLRAPFPGLELVAASARLGTRFRVQLPAAPSRVALRGWVFLSWGPHPEITRCPPREVLARLARWRGRPSLTSDPTVLLSLAALPAWNLTRPPHWSSYDETLELLLSELEAHQELQPA